MPVIPSVRRIIPEKKDIMIMIPAVPGTAMFVNFMYNAKKINIIENIIENKPNMIPIYKGLRE